jgi:hypothetical protein
MKNRIDLDAVHAQLCNALEAERAAQRVYAQVLTLTESPTEHARWRTALQDAQQTERNLCAILSELQLDPECDGVQRRSVRGVGDALLHSLQRAGSAPARLAIARECVRIVAQRERSNWSLLGQLLGTGGARADTGVTPAPRRDPRAAARKPAARSAWFDHAVHFRLRPRHATARQAG